MEKLQGFTDHVMLYVKTLVKWLLAAALIGTVGGAVGSLFRLGVEYATELRTEVPALLYALPLAGVLIVALYRFLRTQGVGTNAVLDAVIRAVSCQSCSFPPSSSPRSSRIWRAAARDVRARRCRSAATSASTSARCCAWTIRTVAWRRCAA